MNRPIFFIFGAPQYGATAWYECLHAYPGTCFSSENEPHSFYTDLPNFRWAKLEEEYLAKLKNCDGAAIIAEASVHYLVSIEAARNIHTFAPAAKIKIIDYEEWVQFLRETYLEVLGFLGVNDDGRCDFPAVKPAAIAVSTTIAHFTRRSLEWAPAIAHLLRRLIRRKRLGVAGEMRRVNYPPNTVRSVSPEFLAEMEDYFREQKKLFATLRSAGNG